MHGCKDVCMHACVFVCGICINISICITALGLGFSYESIGICHDDSISINSSYTLKIGILKNLTLISPTSETLKEPATIPVRCCKC